MSQKPVDAAACLKDYEVGNACLRANWLLHEVGKMCKVPIEQICKWKLPTLGDESPCIRDAVQYRINFGPENQTLMRQVCSRMLDVDPQGVWGPYEWITQFPEDKTTKDNLDRWKEQFGFSPLMQSALGKYYDKKQRLDDAIACWRKVLEHGPHRGASLALAKDYLALGDEAHWLSALQDLMNQPDTGLTHAEVNRDIAEHYMEKNDFRRALPYAEEAAGSWAEWAMKCAAKCHEALGNYKEAGQWVLNCTERYQGSEWCYLYFCARTQRGDMAKARELAKGYKGVAWLVDLPAGDIPKAVESLKSALEDPGRHEQVALRECVLLALLADEAKQNAQRDEALRKAAAWPRKSLWDEHYITLAKAMQAALAAGDGTPLSTTDPQDLRKVVSAGGFFSLFAGRFETLHGSKEKAKEYLTEGFSARVFWKGDMTAVLYGMWCRAAGLDPLELVKTTLDKK